MLGKMMAAAAAASLAFAPGAASAQYAAPTEVAPAAETVEGEELRGGFILPLAFIVAIVLAVILLTGEDEQEPISP